MVDYKFTSIIENDNETKVKVRFYNGAITTENEFDVTTGTVIPITRYRRTSKIDEKEYTYPKDKALVVIKIDINKELLKKGEPIKEQK